MELRGYLSCGQLLERMNNNIIKILFIGLLLCLSTTTNGQAIRKTIEDAWVYIGSWDSLRQAENIELVKSWNTPTICTISFEEGQYSASDELGVYKEKGAWTIEKTENKNFIIVNTDNGQVIKFEIIFVDSNKLKLKRGT
jgi:hypothetical protein